MQNRRFGFGFRELRFGSYYTRASLTGTYPLKADSERLQTSIPETEFEPTENSTIWQRPLIQPSPGVK